ncbi:MAG: methyltransferase domain-containing protein [Chloroflexota bacterium]
MSTETSLSSHITCPELICPKCKGELSQLSIRKGQCKTCDFQYPIQFGIPDLRYPVEQEPDASEQWKTDQLIADYETSSFEELVSTHVSMQDVEASEELIAIYKKYRSGQLERGSQLANMFLERLKTRFSLPDYHTALDLGCGSGAGLVTLSRKFIHVLAIEPQLNELILAKKFCEEQGLTNITFAQAYAQHLPFEESQFSFITAQNVLEHVFTVDEVLVEIERVLKDKGCFAADSRNRFDLFLPEPHVKLRWVGMFPRAWANSYVKWRIGIDYDFVHAHLLSYWDLRRGLSSAFQSRYEIVFPQVSAYNFPSQLDAVFKQLENIKFIARPLLTIFPSHLILAQKQNSA